MEQCSMETAIQSFMLICINPKLQCSINPDFSRKDKAMDTKASDIVMQAAKVRDDGKRVFACAKAFELAKEHDIAVGEIGRICNENGIKIVGCQLGCFK
jgi:hypothetical protein